MQSHQFGSSAFLQSGDYQSDADIYGFAESYQLTSTQLAFTLTKEASAFLSSEEPNQFRVGLNPPQFSNFNGEFHGWCWPGVLDSRGSVTIPPPALTLARCHCCVLFILPGEYRQPYGSEYLSFWGSSQPDNSATGVILRPRLVLVVTGPESELGAPTPPVPDYPAPVSPPGIITSRNKRLSTLTYTCEGGE
jgi:hypothetical protein